MAIRTRKPTGVPPWPLILVEGPEKSGKSYAAAQFTASDKIGQAYWLDLGEGSADEYIQIPGAKYLIVDHNGTWHDIVNQVTEIRDEAMKSKKPTVLIIDSMSTEWEMLKDWASTRALESPFAKRKLREDPNAEIKPSMNLWNDAGDRHYSLMKILMRFPGIVVMTARGKEIAAIGDDGKPIQNAKDYRVEGHKNLPFDASVWMRLSRDGHPQVIGMRSVKAGVQPGVDKPVRRPDLTIEQVVFDILGLDPAKSKAREMTDLVTDEKALADAARAELGAYMREHSISYKPVAERFHQERGESLEESRDPDAIRQLLGELKIDQAQAEAS